MNQDKMHIINKLFKNKTIRTVWDSEKEKYYISVVDIVEVLTDSANPQTYWRVLKKRLKDEGNETVTNCNALKLKAKDGKYRLTDVVDIEGMFRIIESIPSKNDDKIIYYDENREIDITDDVKKSLLSKRKYKKYLKNK